MSVRSRGMLDTTFPEKIALRQSMGLLWGGVPLYFDNYYGESKK